MNFQVKHHLTFQAGFTEGSKLQILYIHSFVQILCTVDKHVKHKWLIFNRAIFKLNN